MGKEKRYHLKKKYVHKSGTIILTKTTVSLLYDETKKIIAFLATIEELPAVQESGEKEILLYDAIKSAGATVTLVDLEGIVLYINHPAPGISKDEFVGSLIYNWLSFDRAEVTKKYIARVKSSGKAIHYESEYTDPTGQIHYFYHSMSPVFSDKKVTSISIVSTEITERRELERKLSRQKDLIALGLNAAEMGVWEWDIIGNKISWDTNTHQAYGWQPGSFPGTPEAFLESIYIEDRPAAISRGYHAIENLDELVEQFRIKRKNDQQIRWISSRSKIFRNDAGKAVSLLGITWDCTKEKEREFDRIKSIELERQNKELKEFTYLASHDLQGPLRTVNSYVQLLNKKYKGKLDEQADIYLNFMSDAVIRMKTQIKDLLDYSLIGQNREIQVIDCSNLIEDILRDLDFNIVEAGAIFEIDTLPKINGYKAELSLLFQNLISNALKFRKKDTNPLIKITAQKEKNFWKFAVKDNGIGIEEQYFKQIFSIFKRLHTQKEYIGTGIGLAHCQKTVALHGGKIWVESEINIGSTFYFTIQK